MPNWLLLAVHLTLAALHASHALLTRGPPTCGDESATGPLLSAVLELLLTSMVR